MSRGEIWRLVGAWFVGVVVGHLVATAANNRCASSVPMGWPDAVVLCTFIVCATLVGIAWVGRK